MRSTKFLFTYSSAHFVINYFTPPSPLVGKRSIVILVSVCLSVCLCVRSHISKITFHVSQNFLYMLSVAVDRSSSHCSAITCTSGFADDMFSYTGPNRSESKRTHMFRPVR